MFRLRSLRSKSRESARTVSLLAGLSEGYLGQVERGRMAVPAFGAVVRLAKVYGVSLDWLAEGDGRGPSAASVRAAVKAASSLPEAALWAGTSLLGQ